MSRVGVAVVLLVSTIASARGLSRVDFHVNLQDGGVEQLAVPTSRKVEQVIVIGRGDWELIARFDSRRELVLDRVGAQLPSWEPTSHLARAHQLFVALQLRKGTTVLRAYELSEEPQVLWEVPLHEGESIVQTTAGPILLSTKAGVRAVDSSSGKSLWETPNGAANAIAVGDAIALVDRELVMVDAKTGVERSRKPAPPGVWVGTVDGSTIATFHENRLLLTDAMTGSARRSGALSKQPITIQSAPASFLIDDGTTITKLDSKTLQERWHATGRSPVVAGNFVVFGSGERKQPLRLNVVELDSGKPRAPIAFGVPKQFCDQVTVVALEAISSTTVAVGLMCLVLD